MKNPNLPDEILMDIFVRLPTKTVGKCRCLSKRWLFDLSTRQFTKTHFERKTHQQNLIFITSSKSLHFITNVKNDTVSSMINLLPGKWTRVIGSCGGLVLLENDYREKLLMNPTTRQHHMIPKSPVGHGNHYPYIVDEFGYDSRSCDYKIVTISYFVEDKNCISDVYVYSVKTGAWKRFDECRTYYGHNFAIFSVCLINGAIHWLKYRKDGTLVIATFGLANEAFDEIHVPVPVDVKEREFNRLVVFEDCLCMIKNAHGLEVSMTDIWIMKEYGVRESWTKISVDADHFKRAINTLCFIGDDEVLLNKGRQMVVYNMKDGSLKDMIIDGAQAKHNVRDHAGTFVDSLHVPFPALHNTFSVIP